MAYTLEQANAALDAILQTTDKNLAKVQLVDLIKQLDVSATGKVTITYSNVSADLVKAVQNSGFEIRVLDNTVASKFLSGVNDGLGGRIQNIKLIATLTTVFDSNPLDSGFNNSSQSEANKFLYGETLPNGTRTPTGAWDIISKNFVSASSGDVITFTPNALSQRVFAQTELPARVGRTRLQCAA